jgi:hypothetical protein
VLERAPVTLTSLTADKSLGPASLGYEQSAPRLTPPGAPRSMPIRQQQNSSAAFAFSSAVTVARVMRGRYHCGEGRALRQEWSPEDLIGSWTLVEEDWRLVGNKTGSTRLGFVILRPQVPVHDVHDLG